MVDFLCSTLNVSIGMVFRVTSSWKHFKNEAGEYLEKEDEVCMGTRGVKCFMGGYIHY